MPRMNDNEMMDFTTYINKVPRSWNLLDSLGLAETVGTETETASVDVETEKVGTFGDTRRGGSRNFVGSEESITKHLTIPFFTLDGVVKPTDIQNLRKIGTADGLKGTNETVLKIMARIRAFHGALREKALMESIKGLSYSPNGTTQQYDYYDTFEVSSKRLTKAMDLANNATDIIELQEDIFGHIIDNADDGANSYNMVCLASPQYFSSLLANEHLQNSYLQYTTAGRSEPLRDRMGGGSIYREFIHGSVRYIEYRGSFNGQALIPANEAFYMPVGISDMFKVHHAPAYHLDYVNTVGQETYMWIHRDPKGRRIDIESETAMLAVNARPELVVRATALASF